MRRLLIAGLLLAFAAGCGGSSSPSRRSVVDTYLRSVNRIELRSGPALQTANETLQKIRGNPTPMQTKKLRAAVAAIDAASTALGLLDPPAEAVEIHRDLLRLHAREAELAREVQGLVEFLPSAREALAPTGVRITQKEVTAAELLAYGSRLRAAATAFAALTPPRALKAWTKEEIVRLRRLARELDRLAVAVRARDATAVRVILLRYQRLVASTGGIVLAQRRGLLAYDQRVKALAELRKRIEAAEVTLNRSLD